MWPNGEIFIDENEEFKKALGGGQVRNWWLLKPSVLMNIVSYARSFGAGTKDTTHKKTQLLGGTFVVVNGEVVYTHRETSTFDNGSAKELLAAVLGKDVKDLPPDVGATPQAEEIVCEMKK